MPPEATCQSSRSAAAVPPGATIGVPHRLAWRHRSTPVTLSCRPWISSIFSFWKLFSDPRQPLPVSKSLCAKLTFLPPHSATKVDQIVGIAKSRNDSVWATTRSSATRCRSPSPPRNSQGPRSRQRPRNLSTTTQAVPRRTPTHLCPRPSPRTFPSRNLRTYCLRLINPTGWTAPATPVCTRTPLRGAVSSAIALRVKPCIF